jgi:hypothetical protein
MAAFGVSGAFLWVALFAAGLLVDSEPYRKAFLGAEEAPLVASLAGDLPAVAAPAPSAEKRTEPRTLATFAKAALFFTPLNAALLALIAAFVGGCASWLAHRDDELPASASPEERACLERRLRFLRESPLTAMLRGFAVYLAVIAGVYITGGDPFDTATASQYVRFAGTVSLLAYLVGYDPTRLQDMLDGMPRLGKKSA